MFEEDDASLFVSLQEGQSRSESPNLRMPEVLDPKSDAEPVDDPSTSRTVINGEDSVYSKTISVSTSISTDGKLIPDSKGKRSVRVLRGSGKNKTRSQSREEDSEHGSMMSSPSSQTIKETEDILKELLEIEESPLEIETDELVEDEPREIKRKKFQDQRSKYNQGNLAGATIFGKSMRELERQNKPITIKNQTSSQKSKQIGKSQKYSDYIKDLESIAESVENIRNHVEANKNVKISGERDRKWLKATLKSVKVGLEMTNHILQINSLEDDISRSTSSRLRAGSYKKFTGQERMRLDTVYNDNKGEVNAEQAEDIANRLGLPITRVKKYFSNQKQRVKLS